MQTNKKNTAPSLQECTFYFCKWGQTYQLFFSFFVSHMKSSLNGCLVVFVNTALCSYAHKTLYREVCGHVFLKREFVSIEKALSKVTLHG